MKNSVLVSYFLIILKKELCLVIFDFIEYLNFFGLIKNNFKL